MTEHEDRSRWGREDPDAEQESDTVEPTETEAPESDEEAIVGVQPGTAADVPFNDDDAPSAPDEADDEEASTDGTAD